MAKKKIVISESILQGFEQNEERQIDDISLKFVLSDSYHTVNVDLTPLINGTLERKKEIYKFKNFIVNTHRSLSSKKGYCGLFKQMVLAINKDFNGDILERIKLYSSLLIEKVKKKSITVKTYHSFRNDLKIIFTECYNINYKDYYSVFPEYMQRTDKIHNATILDNNGKEKAFSKTQFKEISKILLRLHDFYEELLTQPKNNQYSTTFTYQNIYKLEIDLRNRDYRYIKNRKTVCLMLAFICLTGVNLSPLIRMKRSDIVIDRDRKVISFQATCNRKNKQQSHTFPMRENQLIFFEKIIQNSLQVSNGTDILFPFISDDLSIAYFNHGASIFLNTFNKGFCGEYEGITINTLKLRHSFGSQFDDIDLRSIALFNNINTTAKHYSSGNSKENNEQLQEAMNIYTIALSASEDIKIVKDNIGKINVINIKDISSLKKENSQITSSGLFCINSKDGNEPEKFARKLEKLNLTTIESINCANILACFNCKNSIIVNDFENIYILKSFYNYLNNVVYESNTSSLFSDKNAVKNAILSIQIVLETKIDKKVITKVDKHIIKYGNHPLWEINGEFV